MMKKTGSSEQNVNNKRKPKHAKTYAYSAIKDRSLKDAGRELLPKVNLPSETEKSLVNFVLTEIQKRDVIGCASFKLNARKLTDLYDCLAQTGFSHKQIEMGMRRTVLSGGDLITVLDWLCLHLEDADLPQGFSDQMERIEKKRDGFAEEAREKFMGNVDLTAGRQQDAYAMTIRHRPDEEVVKRHLEEEQSITLKGSGMKEWILNYSNVSSDEEDQLSTNERYIVAASKLLEVKAEAAEAKVAGDKKRQRDASSQIRTLIQEVSFCEAQPDFDCGVRILNENDMAEVNSEVESRDAERNKNANLEIRQAKADKLNVAAKERSGEEGGCDILGGLFDEEGQLEKKQVRAAEKKLKTPLDKREFSYTRQQWTGKSPKQFLIDWVRKHLPKSPAPKFQRINCLGNTFKCSGKIEMKPSPLIVTPEIVCENLKEAEHLASTLLLYKLCGDQKIHLLLPPPYRDVWLEWENAKRTEKAEEVAKVNKPRDLLVKQMMKSLKLDSTNGGEEQCSGNENDAGTAEAEVEESWESLADRPAPHLAHALRHTSCVSQTELFEAWENCQQRRCSFKNSRESLPIYKFRREILDCIGRNQVVIVSGDTGSGKSTQVPQYIMEHHFMNNLSLEKTNIIVTQPRRISAVSLAARVAQEIGSPAPGQPCSLVGHAIRFENRCGRLSRLQYCTAGVLLRRLQTDADLSDVSHVVVDEVHERNLQTDLILLLLRELIARRPSLKLILMSATLNAEKFCSYFRHAPHFSIPGRTFPVEIMYLEDFLEQLNYQLPSDSPYSLREDQLTREMQLQVEVSGMRGQKTNQTVCWTREELFKIDTTDLDGSRYSLKTRNTISRMNSRRINLDLILDLLKWIETSRELQTVDGAIIVFLPGIFHIQQLYDMISSDRFFGKNRFQVFLLHSAVDAAAQSSVFAPSSSDRRKIVLATNIAETGITIPDVVFVIDTGKVKVKRYVENTGFSSLDEVDTSKASSKQRGGRAGRVRPGFCFRLFTESQFHQRKEHELPEILRIPLEELCLYVMAGDFGSPEEFLGLALDPPSKSSILRAMRELCVIGAVVSDQLTPLGHHLARLPVDAKIGKMLVYGSIFGCLRAVAIIGAFMSEQNVFSYDTADGVSAEKGRASYAVSNSDHVTFYKIYQSWRDACRKSKRAAKEFCRKLSLKESCMENINNISQELVLLVEGIGFTGHSNLCGSAYEIGLVKLVLAAGLYPNVAAIKPQVAPVEVLAKKERCVAISKQGPITIHNSSVNHLLSARGWILFQEKLRQFAVTVRDTTLINAIPLLLFGGTITVHHRQQLIIVDGWIKMKAVARTAVIFKEMRNLLSDLLQRKLEQPDLDTFGSPLVQHVVQLSKLCES